MQLTSFLILSSFPLEDVILSIFPFHPRSFPRGFCSVIAGNTSIRSVLSPIFSVLLYLIHVPCSQGLLPGTSQVPVQPFRLLKETVPVGASLAVLFQPCKAFHSPETSALHCHNVTPLGHRHCPAFPGHNKRLLPVTFSFPEMLELRGAGTEQSHRAVLAL